MLEFLPHGDLKTFLTVSLTIAPQHCIIQNVFNNNHTEKETTSEQIDQVYAGYCYWDALYL